MIGLIKFIGRVHPFVIVCSFNYCLFLLYIVALMSDEVRVDKAPQSTQFNELCKYVGGFSITN